MDISNEDVHDNASQKETKKSLQSYKMELITIFPALDRIAVTVLGVPYIGCLLAIFASFLFTLNSVQIKKWKEVNPIYLSMYSLAGLFLGSSVILIHMQKHPFPKKYRRLLIIRGCAGSFSMICIFVAVHFLPLVSVAVIVISVPVFVSILARIILNEKITVIKIIAMFIAICGVIAIINTSSLISPKDKSFNQLKGVFAALGSVILASIAAISMRLMRKVNFSIIIFNFGLTGLIITLTTVGLFDIFIIPKCVWEILNFSALGIVSFITQCFLTLAIKLEEVSTVSMLRILDILFAYIWQHFIFHEDISIFSIIGAVLVILSVFLVTIQKILITCSDNNKIKINLKFLLK